MLPTDVDLNPYFFGNEAVQRQISDDLAASLYKKKGDVYLVTGGERSGKTSAIESVQKQLKRDRSFMLHESPEAHFTSSAFSKLAGILGIDKGDRSLFQAKDQSHEIFFVEEFIDLNKVRQVMEAHRKLPSGHKLSIVIDMPIHDYPLLPGIQTIAQQKKYERFKEKLELLQQRYPELTVLHTAYDKEKIKTALWKMSEEYCPEGVKNVLYDSNVDVKHPAIRNMLTALEEENYRKYKQAFDRLPLQGKLR